MPDGSTSAAIGTPNHPAPPEFDVNPDGVDEGILLGVLDEVCAVIGAAGVPWILIGGIACAVFGRPRWSDDIDVFLRPEDAERSLEALAAAGYETHHTYPDWLFKAFKEGVLVDLIFKSAGDVYLDDEMLRRSRVESFHGHTVRVASPEDLLVMKTLAHSEPTPRYWHDALGVLSRSNLDWDYLLQRARQGPRRILSLLLYAQSNDLAVPDPVVDRLYRFVRGDLSAA